jgi:hypothetical protein
VFQSRAIPLRMYLERIDDSAYAVAAVSNSA